jgi:alkylation response protein AidB-like acyl-CoA dehydrogenase
MDWSDSEEQAEFRARVRSVIGEKLPERYRGRGRSVSWQHDRASEVAEERETAMGWNRALGEHGWVAPHWPTEYGGAGMTAMEQFIFNHEMADAGAPMAASIHGVSMLGPTLIVHGTEEQRQKHLPKILSAEVVWCQGYSEPGAGSDLASLQTRAVRDGDDYVLNGQKIWTSGAQTADWTFALVRTEPDAPKHRGISFVMADLKTPGLTTRPIIGMDWGSDLNETFFEDVRVPVGNLVGEENRGWYVGMTLLDFERSGISNAVGIQNTVRGLIEAATTGAAQAQSRLGTTPMLRGQVADRFIEANVGFQFSLLIISMQAAGQVPNHEASVAKLFMSELGQRVALTGTKVFGLYSNLWDESEERAPAEARFTRSYVSSIPSTIAGGSSEIQRNIVATRGLGLPRG